VVDDATLTLTVCDDSGERLRASLADPAGRAEAEAFFHDLVPSLASPPRLVRAAGGGHFMDKPDNVISLINLATLRQLEQRWSVKLDPLRFRANIYIDGAPPWAEFDWVGHEIRLGSAVFHVDRRNGRCGATNVDPATGQRDLDIPRSLRAMFGHKDLGVYLLARNDATIAVGDPLEAPGIAPIPTAAPEPPARPVTGAAFICAGCYYIYDPAIRAADTPDFANLPSAWRCPDCGTDKTKFRPHMRQSALAPS
jgi:GntR family transcriptional regulator/MocR family aminotransferase